MQSYYYDTETGFYYLQSRYYDPANHRFINADAYASTGQSFLGYNMFAYCLNNPVNASDPTGNGVPDYLERRWRELTFRMKHTSLSIFGAGATAVYQTKHEVEHSPAFLNLLLSVKSGVKSTKTISSSGDSTRPISVYAQGRTDNYLLSSAGLKINASGGNANLSLGLDNIGLSFSSVDGNNATSVSIVVDVSQLKVGFEYAETITQGSLATTSYNNISITGIGILAIIYFVETGEWNPSLQPA